MALVRYIFFDIDDTLYSSSELSKKARRAAVEHMIAKGLELDVDEAYEKLMNVVKRYGSNYGKHFDRLFTDELGVQPDYRMVAAGVVAYHHTKFVNIRPYPHAVETIIELKVRGYGLGIITDGIPVKQWEKLVRLGLDDFFDPVVISEDRDVGFSKPSPRIFEIALERAGVSAKDAAMVGDKLLSDIKGAAEAGMRTVWLLTPRDSSDLPEKMGVRPDHVVTEIRQLLKLFP